MAEAGDDVAKPQVAEPQSGVAEAAQVPVPEQACELALAKSDQALARQPAEIEQAPSAALAEHPAAIAVKSEPVEGTSTAALEGLEGLDFDLDEDGQQSGDVDGNGDDDMAGSEEDAKGHDSSKCACCQDEPKVDRSIYGLECKKALNNVEKKEVKATAKKGERWAKWCELKRAGGSRLFSVLLAYRHTCSCSSGPGRARGSFDFLQHYEEVQSVAEVTTGEKLVYMTLQKWLMVAQEDLGYDTKSAEKQWTKKKTTLPRWKKKQSPAGLLMLPMPKECFVTGSNASRHIKGMRLEGNKIKKPTQQHLDNAEKHVGSGHLGFGDQAFAKAGGGSLVDNAQGGGSLMFAPDGDSIFGAGANFRSSVFVSRPMTV